MNVCVIPARGGSKRIPRKNIKDFCGKPMLAYAIEVAKNSQLFSRIVVSTDDVEIANIAHRYGAEVLKRPESLADDYATTVAVIRHSIDALNLADNMNVCCLYPCTPLLTAQIISNAYQKWITSNAKFCIPVLEFESSIYRSLKLNERDEIVEIFDNENTRTQDLQKAYYDAGQFYWGSAKSWAIENKIREQSVAFVLSKNSVVDIDTPDDWQFAELLYQVQNGDRL